MIMVLVKWVGILLLFAQSGFTVYLNDIKEEFVQGIDNIAKQFAQ